MKTTKTQRDYSQRYNEKQVAKGMTQTKAWIPAKYVDWHRTLAENLRFAAANNTEPAIPPLPKA